MKQPIIPVVDLLGGRVVRGVAGRRSEYQPIISPWSQCADPLEIVQGIQREWGFADFYVADLDAILHNRSSWDVYASLVAAGARLMLDAGVRDLNQAVDLACAGIDRIVIALETLDDPRLLTEFVEHLGAERLVFSLDLMHGQPLSRCEWGELRPVQIVEQVTEAGIMSIIVLDLAGVGVGEGIPTLTLCREIRHCWPDLELITGGGVRGASDITAALECGVDSVLVASALHDGRIRNGEALTSSPSPGGRGEP